MVLWGIAVVGNMRRLFRIYLTGDFFLQLTLHAPLRYAMTDWMT